MALPNFGGGVLVRNLVLGCATLMALLSLGDARAADMGPPPAPVYKGPNVVPPPAFSWTGLYLGVEGGWGWGREDYSDNSIAGFPPGVAISQRPNGGVVGGVLGYRYQIGQFVLGAEGTAAWADLKGTVTPGPGVTDSLKVRSLYTATGQAGWAFDQALLYVKGGWAGASVNTAIATVAGGLASQSQTDNGWTVGGGLDYAIWQNLILGVEYDHFDLNYGAFTTVGVLGRTYVVRNPSRLTIEQAVGRLTYKFNIP
jgi:outer membrane immunogenic protein